MTASILENFSNVFEGIGKLEGIRDILLDSGVKPVAHVLRRIPLTMMNRGKDQQESVQQSGIIAKIDKPRLG